MGTADGNRHFVIFHHLSQELRPCESRNAKLFCGQKLRVIAFYGSGINDQVYCSGKVFLALAIEDSDASFFQHTGQIGRCAVRA